MAKITLGGNPAETNGELPAVGSKAPEFTLTGMDLSDVKSNDFDGKNMVLNVFPSVDTNVCATSVRTFNAEAASLDNTVILNISKDLPFAQKRFCGAEGIENAITLSEFKNNHFSDAYGLRIIGGAFDGLHSRVIVVIDTEGNIKYTEQVPEIGQEPNYKAALAALK